MRFLLSSLVFLIAFLLSGCSTISPPNNLRFKNEVELKDFEGIYSNYGETGKTNDSYYLSRIFWDSDLKHSHLQVNAIKIEQTSNRALKVSAYEKQNLISEKIIDVENDYVLSERGLTLKDKAYFSFYYPPGNIALGLVTDYKYFGVDEEYNIKLQEGGLFIGLAGVLPVILMSRTDVRFKRYGNVR